MKSQRSQNSYSAMALFLQTTRKFAVNCSTGKILKRCWQVTKVTQTFNVQSRTETTNFVVAVNEIHLKQIFHSLIKFRHLPNSQHCLNVSLATGPKLLKRNNRDKTLKILEVKSVPGVNVFALCWLPVGWKKIVTWRLSHYQHDLQSLSTIKTFVIILLWYSSIREENLLKFAAAHRYQTKLWENYLKNLKMNLRKSCKIQLKDLFFQQKLC